jgi:Mn2+/Fe2+ NRAMP family transporter
MRSAALPRRPKALRPFAGNVAGLLFALGMIGVGALAVPVMTTGAAYDLCQSFGWQHGLSRKPREAKAFYAVIIFFSAAALGLNFTGINPMKALVFAGVVQGFSTPPLLLLILLMTNQKKIMGKRTNSKIMNILGWATTLVIFLGERGTINTMGNLRDQRFLLLPNGKAGMNPGLSVLIQN